jgi:hypothetical protein
MLADALSRRNRGEKITLFPAPAFRVELGVAEWYTSVASGLYRCHSMAKPSSEDPRLSRLSKLALALPEVTRHIYGSHAQFLVRKKTFAYFLDNHHGDGIVAVTCKVLPGDNKALTEAQPDRFYLPAYLASRGWVALRLDAGKIDWEEVNDLVMGSYALIAPSRLAEQVKGLL